MEIDHTKGKLIFNDYLSPKYDKMRYANKLMKYGCLILSFIGFVGYYFYRIQLFLGMFLVFLIGFFFVILTERSYKNSISVYENGLEVECGKPRGGGSTWSVGKKFIPFSEIESIYHETEMGDPEIGKTKSILGLMIINIKIKG